MTDTQREQFEKWFKEWVLSYGASEYSADLMKLAWQASAQVAQARIDECAQIMLEHDENAQEAIRQLTELEARSRELCEAMQEVIRISDRKHDAWDKVKALLATQPTEALNRFRNEVIDECLDCFHKNTMWDFAMTAIRALKKEVK